MQMITMVPHFTCVVLFRLPWSGNNVQLDAVVVTGAPARQSGHDGNYFCQ